MGSVSEAAALLGQRGGKVSKRRPGALRRILMEVCEELDSTANKDVFRYWQTHGIAACADHAPQATCWWRHCLYAKSEKDYTLPKAFYVPGSAEFGEKPECVERPHNTEYRYFYFDGRQQQEATAKDIRDALYRIRTTA